MYGQNFPLFFTGQQSTPLTKLSPGRERSPRGLEFESEGKNLNPKVEKPEPKNVCGGKLRPISISDLGGYKPLAAFTQ